MKVQKPRLYNYLLTNYPDNQPFHVDIGTVLAENKTHALGKGRRKFALTKGTMSFTL